MRSRRKTVTWRVGENGCHICTSHHIVTSGYPCVEKDGRNQNLHRVLYEELHGVKLSSDVKVRHTCDVPACINPEHWLTGTAYDNAQDRNTRGRNNPPIGERSGTAKLTTLQVLSIKHATTTQQATAEKFGITQSQVSRIKAGKRWNHV